MRPSPNTLSSHASLGPAMSGRASLTAMVEARSDLDVSCTACDGIVTGWSRDGVPTHAQKPARNFGGVVAFYTADETVCVRRDVQSDEVARCFRCHHVDHP
jgi:hypothetical protein